MDGFHKMVLAMYHISYFLWSQTDRADYLANLSLVFQSDVLDKLCCTYVYRAYSAGRRAVG